jgi:carbon storage regulator
MLVLSRKRNEKILVGNDITITVVEILPDRVRLGVTAPQCVPVVRAELSKTWHNRRKATNGNGLERPPA